MHNPNKKTGDEVKQREFLKQQQQLRAMGKPSMSSKVMSAETMIENLLSKRETFQKKADAYILPPHLQGLSEWLVPGREHPVYEAVWQVVKSQTGSSMADTGTVSALLMTSGMPTRMLGYIWALANQTVPGILTQAELYAVLALVALAQEGYVFDSLTILQQLPIPLLPRLDYSKVPALPLPPPTTSLPQTTSVNGLHSASVISSSITTYIPPASNLAASVQSVEPPSSTNTTLLNGHTINVTASAFHSSMTVRALSRGQRSNTAENSSILDSLPSVAIVDPSSKTMPMWDSENTVSPQHAPQTSETKLPCSRLSNMETKILKQNDHFSLLTSSTKTASLAKKGSNSSSNLISCKSSNFLKNKISLINYQVSSSSSTPLNNIQGVSDDCDDDFSDFKSADFTVQMPLSSGLVVHTQPTGLMTQHQNNFDYDDDEFTNYQSATNIVQNMGEVSAILNDVDELFPKCLVKKTNDVQMISDLDDWGIEKGSYSISDEISIKNGLFQKAGKVEEFSDSGNQQKTAAISLPVNDGSSVLLEAKDSILGFSSNNTKPYRIDVDIIKTRSNINSLKSWDKASHPTEHDWSSAEDEITSFKSDNWDLNLGAGYFRPLTLAVSDSEPTTSHIDLKTTFNEKPLDDLFLRDDGFKNSIEENSHFNSVYDRVRDDFIEPSFNDNARSTEHVLEDDFGEFSSGCINEECLVESSFVSSGLDLCEPSDKASSSIDEERQTAVLFGLLGTHEDGNLCGVESVVKGTIYNREELSLSDPCCIDQNKNVGYIEEGNTTVEGLGLTDPCVEDRSLAGVSNTLSFRQHGEGSEDRYSALRMLEFIDNKTVGKEDGTDDFGDYITGVAVLQNSGLSPATETIDQLKPSDSTTMQVSCLEAALTQLGLAVSALKPAASSDQVLAEIVGDARGKVYLDGLSEIYSVCTRILRLTEKPEQLLSRLESSWSQLAPLYALYTPNKLLETPGPACCVCLSSFGPAPVVFGLNNFHAPCANLYIHFVDPSLPIIRPA